MAQRANSRYATETILDQDLISRCCYAIEGIGDLDPATHFNFSPANHPEYPLTISVVWRKYAIERHDVDQRGEAIAKDKNRPGRRRNRSSMLIYIGYRTATAQTIRAIRSEHEFKFSVTHAPSNDFLAHAQIAIEHTNHLNPPALTPSEKMELISQLVDAMPIDDTQAE